MNDAPSDFWRKLVRELMTEKRVSERRLCAWANVPRGAFSRWLKDRDTRFTIDKLERILRSLDHQLTPIKREEG